MGSCLSKAKQSQGFSVAKHHRLIISTLFQKSAQQINRSGLTCLMLHWKLDSANHGAEEN